MHLHFRIHSHSCCFIQPAAIDFSSGSAFSTSGIAFEDSSVLVLHQVDLGESLCALAIEAYGEDNDDIQNEFDAQTTDSVLNRGTRQWRNMVAGATLCCSQCCAPLGVASAESPETSRLWKHRLTTATEDFAHHSAGTFLANEMVRYAESKAVFTFVVVMPSVEQMGSTTKPCLLLRLLSWDTRLALSRDSTRTDQGVDMLCFRRVAKLIYEETVEPIASQLDVTSWKWGGVDLCCAIPEPRESLDKKSDVEATTHQASVRICLPTEEWHKIRNSLREGSKLFSQDVASATITVKIGKVVSESDAIGLSILPLP